MNVPHNSTETPLGQGSGTHGQPTAPPQAQSSYSGAPGMLGFFNWLRNLGINREPGWFGGVAAGLAHRMNLDVALVRGILVVLGVLGLPVLFAYGIAWLLLPDSTGKIHLEELLRGNPEAPLIGIGFILLMSVSSIGRGIWPAFHGFNFSFFGGFWATLWSLAIIAGVIAAIYFISRSLWWQQSPQQSMPSNFSAAYPMPATPGTEGDASPTAAGFAPSNPSATTRPEPLPPQQPLHADESQMAAWREQQQAWRAEHAAWKAEQQYSHEQWRAAERARQQEERRARMAEHRLKMEEYRIRNPRLPGAAVLMIIGVAIIIGSLVSITVTEDQFLVGVTTTALVLALGMIGAALAGRRTASLGWLNAILLINVLIWSVFSGLGTYLSIGNNDLSASSAQAEAYTLPVGSLQIYLDNLEPYLNTQPSETTLRTEQGIGQTRIYVPVDASVHIQASVGIGSISVRGNSDLDWQRDPANPGIRPGESSSGFGRDVTFHNGFGQPDFTVVVEVGIGSIVIIPLEASAEVESGYSADAEQYDINDDPSDDLSETGETTDPLNFPAPIQLNKGALTW